MASTAPNVGPLFGCSAQMTLQARMLADEQRFPDSNGSLSRNVSALAISAKTISARLRRARLEDVLGEVGGENIQGERQQKLDIIANDVLIQILHGREGVAVLGSEEEDELLFVTPEALTARAMRCCLIRLKVLLISMWLAVLGPYFRSIKPEQVGPASYMPGDIRSLPATCSMAPRRFSSSPPVPARISR